MTITVVFTPEAEADLLELYGYIAEKTSPLLAADFTGSIVDFCQSLTTFPQRGTRRDDIRAGLRTTGFRHQVTIAFGVDGEAVSIIGIYYGGRDFEALLRDSPD